MIRQLRCDHLVTAWLWRFRAPPKKQIFDFCFLYAVMSQERCEWASEWVSYTMWTEWIIRNELTNETLPEFNSLLINVICYEQFSKVVKYFPQHLINFALTLLYTAGHRWPSCVVFVDLLVRLLAILLLRTFKVEWPLLRNTQNIFFSSRLFVFFSWNIFNIFVLVFIFKLWSAWELNVSMFSIEHIFEGFELICWWYFGW